VFWTRTYRLLRATVFFLVTWYVLLIAFSLLYPYCSPGEEPIFAVCYLGDINLGPLYHYICWISFLWAVPMHLAIGAAFLYSWQRHRENAQVA
jgi:hypothetical protein